MILFKCHIGYIPGSAGRYTNLSLNDVTITDPNVYISIITQYDGAFPSGSKTVEDFNSACSVHFGSDAGKIWVVPVKKNAYTDRIYTLGWVPSAPAMYPVIWSIVNSLPNNSTVNPVFIFPQLRKAFDTLGVMYEIRNNKFVYYSVQGVGAELYYYNQSFGYPIISNYTPGMDLTTATWLFLTATTNTSDTRPSSVGVANNSAKFMAWLLEDNPTPDKETTPDPYSPGGNSGAGGGTGNFDGTGDDIDIPNLPTLSAVSTGFITLFNPTITQLNDLASYMWTNPIFDPANWRKLFADPMDAILGLSIVPVAVPDGGTSTVTVGNISTGVTMTKAARQYVEIDCGTLNVNEYWGAYLDYDPYTKAEIYLPYIGTHALAVDDIMQKPVHVVYHVDILSGACAAYVKCGGSVLYTFIGQCSSSIPISGNDWTNVINGVLSIAGSVGSMVAVGGAAAPLVAPALASNAINGIKPNVEKSGSLAGTGGMLGVQVPYLILTRPRQALPARQNAFAGYPSFITRQLSELSGYTEISDIHLENVPATEQELSEIVSLLKGGVIL